VGHFTVDSRLLRELGERLVGQPHIALAELIKNAFDADSQAAAERVYALVLRRRVEAWVRPIANETRT